MTRRRRILVAVLAGGLAALGAGAASSSPRVRGRVRDRARSLEAWAVARVPQRLRENPESVLEPAPLSRLHAAVPELRDCRRCHELAAPVRGARCLDCHEEVSRRLASGEGYHGARLRGECRDCHAEHRAGIVDLDAAAFNHQLARFKLEGRHAEVACAKCHEKPAAPPATGTRLAYLGLESDRCVACHEDPHRGSLDGREGACLACHTQEGFDGRHLLFRHDRDAAFPLDGRHAGVACAKCHVPPAGSSRLADARLSPLSHECASCHEDPHRKSLEPRACIECHTTAGFRGEALRFDHQTMSRFRLDPAHRDLACASCHASSVFRPTLTSCEGCHTGPAAAIAGNPLIAGARERWAPDPHAGRVDCVRCHDGGTARATAADHAARCASCHTPHYAGLSLERRARLDGLAASGRALLADAPAASRPAAAALARRLEDTRRAGAHDPVEAERRARALVDDLRSAVEGPAK